MRLFAFTALTLIYSAAFAGKWFLNVEGGMAIPGYNDVQVPNDSSGTRFSLSDALDIPSKAFFRINAGYETGRHTLSVFAAPLQFNAEGKLPEDILFAGESFSADETVEALYRFNSYRMRWRYLLSESENYLFKIGFSAKIRHAEIRLESSARTGSTKNTGFVPLLSFELRWLPAENLTVLLEGDALAAPMGRAEDVFLGVELPLSGKVDARAGYRIVEGGADVKSVYSFTMVNCISAGLNFRF
ncbi:hypothetical protein CSA37_07845 [Candidatus Fermentibacteria bacterium]|nr:MAG: hypothetical protein CSA37_07845 [Candidatus Fermentibacteria bacterium]